MSCVNPNSPEFQAILKTEPNFLLAELLYKKQIAAQDTVLYDDVREFKENIEVKKETPLFSSTDIWEYSAIADGVLINDTTLAQLRKNPAYKITDPVELEKINQLSSAIGEKEAYRDYFEHGQVVRTSDAVNKKINDRITTEETDQYAQPMEEIVDTAAINDFIEQFDSIVKDMNETAAIQVAEKFSERLNIPYEIISQEEMNERFPDQPARKNFYQAGKVYLVKGSINQDSVFHEFSHPIIKSMSVQNPELFASLFNELAGTEVGQQIINDLNNDPYYVNGSPEYMEEAIVMALQSEQASPEKAPEGFFKNLFFQIKQFLRKVFGKKINISLLSSKTTLSEMVKMINYGEEFILDTDFLDKNLMVMFQTDYNAIVDQIKISSTEKTQALMNSFYEVVKVQVANFTKQNDIYQTIAEDLANENNEGALQQMKAILEGMVTIGSSKLTKPLNKLVITGNKALDADIISFNSRIESFAKVLSTADTVFDLLQKKLQDLKVSGVKEDSEFDQLFAIIQYNNDWLDKLQSWKASYTGDLDGFFPLMNGKSPLRDALIDLINKLSDTKKLSQELQIDSTLDILHDHLEKQLAPAKKDLEDQMATARANNNNFEYNRLHNQLFGLEPIEYARFNILKNKTNLTLNEETELLQLTLDSYDSYQISKDALKARAEGKLADSHKWNGMFESYMNNQDTVVGGFYSYLMKTFNTIDGNANAKRAKMLDGLRPLLKAAGYDDHWVGEGKLGKAIGQKNTSFENDKKGGVAAFEEWRFMSNFVNHEYPIQQLKNAVSKARKEYNHNPDDKNELVHTNAKKALDQFEEDYMHRDYVKEYYAVRKKYFFTPMGEKALDALEDIFKRMEIIADNINQDPALFGKSNELNAIWVEYQHLHSMHDIYGVEKKGDAKKVAEILSEFRKEMSEFYEWNEKEGLFEEAVEAYSQFLQGPTKNLLPGTPEYDEEFKQWFDVHTTITVKQEYYDIKDELMEERSSTLAPIKNVNDSIIDVGPMYKKVFDILKPTRDNFNQFDGSQLTPEAQQVIRDTQHDINQIKELWLQNYGKNKDEVRVWREIDKYQNEHNGQFKTLEDEVLWEEFWSNLAIDLYENFGLTKAHIDYVKDIDKNMNSMSTSGLTNYYITEFMALAKLNPESIKLVETKLQWADLSTDDIPTSDWLFEAIADIKFTNELSAINPEFKVWFDRNHYVKLTDKFNENDGSFIEEIEENRPTSAWQYSMPAKQDMYESKSVIGSAVPDTFMPNGFILIDGVPRVPSRAYFKRTVKAQYQTEEIFKDEDQNGVLKLATKDNRNRWLPRDFVPGDPASAKDGKFIDQNYKAMFNDEKPLWNLLDHLKLTHLHNQEGLDNAQKMFLSYPRYRKGNSEVYDKDYFRRKIQRTTDVWNVAVDDVELGLYSGTGAKKLDYTTLTRPIGGSYRLPINDVSTNIVDSLMDQAYSIEHFKAIRKINSFANLYQSSIENLAMYPEVHGVQQNLQDAQLVTPTKDISQQIRIKQIKSILDKHFKGITLYKTDNDKSTLRTAKVIGKLQGAMSFASFAFDPIKSLTNYFGAKNMMWIKAVEGRLYTFKDLAATRAMSLSIIGEITANQYSNEQVSAILQLMDVGGAIPGNLKKEIGRRGSKTVSQAVMEGDIFYADRKMLNDSVPIHQFLALLHKESFMLNGKMTPLYKAIELVDGRIQTKAGVPDDMSITYDAKGDIILGDKFKDVMNTQQALMQKSLGVANEFNEPEMYRHILGKFTFFLLKFFPPMFSDRYGVRTKKGKIGHKKFNYNTKQAEVGTYLSIIKLGQEIISNKGSLNHKNYSWQAKKGSLQLIFAILMNYIINLITSSIGFDNDDDGEMDYEWDIEADHIYSKLTHSTALPALPFVSERRTLAKSGRSFNAGNYFKMQALRLLLRVKKENNTFFPTTAVSTAGGLLLLNSPLSDGGALKTILEVTSSLMEGAVTGKYDTYKQTAGPMVWQQKESMKEFNKIMKLFGLNGSLIDPAGSIERENSDFFGK